MPRLIRVFLLALCAVLLLSVRAFEESLFYDPLLHYFRADHHTEPLPQMQISKFFANLVFRFGINTVLSLFVLWLVFQKRGVIKLAGVLYVAIGAILMVVMACLIVFPNDSLMALFYVRRFLIQPLLLLLLLPAFYFHRNK